MRPAVGSVGEGGEEPPLVIQGRRVLLPNGIGPAAIVIAGGAIRSVEPIDSDLPGAAVLDTGEKVVMPGIVDTHVHVNEPGRTEWEGFESATRAAAAGGITTVIDMPLNSIPPTTTAAALEAKLAAADGRCRVDYGFWGGVVPGNDGDLVPLLEAGALGFKAFLAPSGVDEFRAVTEGDLRRAMPILADRGAVLLIHAEWPDRLGIPPGGRRYADYLASRPAAAEEEAIDRAVALCEEYRGPLHVVHLATGTALESISRAKATGLPLTVETCPHYLTFAAEEIDDGETLLKCAPPIRESDHRDRLWRALGEGLIDLVASDHSPCPPAMKALDTGDFGRAWGGIASLQLALPAVWTAARLRGFGLEDLVRWMCLAPVRLSGLEARKGAIAPGYDADLVVWDPDATFCVRPQILHHRHAATPYEGRTLYGVVERTFVRGRLVYGEGSFPGEPSGRWLHREAA